MKRAVFLVFIIMCFSFLIACTSAVIEDYKKATPELLVEDFFSGDLIAYGIVRDRSGKVIRHFKAGLRGTWERGVGTLDEVFWFNDDKRETRIWTLTPTTDGYKGTASDVVGEADIKVRGNAMHLKYKLRVPYKDDEIVLSMNDWMYQVVPGVVMNETTMTKFGFEVGKITLVIIKDEALPVLSQLVASLDGEFPSGEN